MKNPFDSISINKYYLMNDDQLTEEASRWNIRGFATSNGIIERQVIIDALLKKDIANNSRLALIISVIAIFISVLSFLLHR